MYPFFWNCSLFQDRGNAIKYQDTWMKALVESGETPGLLATRRAGPSDGALLHCENDIRRWTAHASSIRMKLPVVLLRDRLCDLTCPQYPASTD